MKADEHADPTCADLPGTEAPVAGPTDPSPAVPTDEELQALREERDDLVARLEGKSSENLRLLAEFQTFRRRTQQEKEALRRVATEALVVALLPVLDTFERSLAAIEAGAEAEAVAQGIRMVEAQFRATLANIGLERLQSVGDAFDPQLHEAVAIEDGPGHADGTVTAEVEAGYRLAGKVVRPARVRIARNPS